MRDFQAFGKSFKLNKIDALKQFHIVRRVGPILSELLPVMKEFKSVPDGEEAKLDMIAKLASPLMEGLSKLSDQDSEMVLYGLLSSVEMQQASGNWARVSTPQMLMIQDLELPMMLQIAGRAFIYNLSGFISGLPKSS